MKREDIIRIVKDNTFFTIEAFGIGMDTEKIADEILALEQVTDEEIEKWINTLEFEKPNLFGVNTIYKAGLRQGAKAMRDGEINRLKGQ